MSSIWLNGEFLPADKPALLASDRGLTLGDGLFETIAVKAGAPLRLEAHCQRLRSGADFLGLRVPLADDALANAVAGIVAANGLHDAAVRLTLTAGPAPRGLPRPAMLAPTLLLTAGPLPGELPPARLIIATRTCRNEHSPLSRLKTLNYLDSIIARNEAQARGADDAILLNSRGQVAEASAANLFVRLDGHWLTPPVSDGALPGTMRAALLKAWGAGERSLLPADLDRAEEMVLTTALGIRPVSTVSG
ncbi:MULTISPECIES: aminotransferase class IV [Azospirillaceae]|uniref:aminotransferase class IV n=1 Tax=Azospirillaceae TaxID=2829815 RepID=UPI000B67CEA5|nr:MULTISPECIES: aminotransferase class IV [Azospirillaceae]MDG5494581.1 aminotransferase class IV [Niveispirillum sp. BGYR6]SNS38417.1 branched-chain amino acid aminotransferase [Azospirillum sp. RU38E]SNS57000.1 branched-chain amino acid aminotransferase [Azospirillum sp. RU37A]